MKTRIFVALLLVISVSACKNKDTEKETIKDDIIPVKVMPVMRDTMSTSFKSSGYFTTDNETPLSFKNGGIILAIYVKEGDAVKAGQLLAKVDAAEIISATQQAELAYQKAMRDYQRATSLYHDSVATLEQMQNAKTALDLAKQQKAAADFNNMHSEIRALSSGYVLKKYLNVGQLAGPGLPVLLVSGSAKNGWIFKTGVSDFQWSSIQIGDDAEITTDAAPGKIIQATVLKKSEGVDPQTGAFTIQLSVKPESGVRFASGLFGKATLFPSKK
jgi:RND family efflux transporter MFP subunit